MKYILLTVALVMTATTPASMRAQNTDPLIGEWTGGTNLLGAWRVAEARFVRSGDAVSGSFDIQSANGMRMPMRAISPSRDSVRFEIVSAIGVAQRCRHASRRRVRGNAYDGRRAGELHLVRVAPVRPALFARYVGTYRVRTARLWSSRFGRSDSSPRFRPPTPAASSEYAASSRSCRATRLRSSRRRPCSRT